jgi:ABC-type lipoprotein release transport system permease subunit
MSTDIQKTATPIRRSANPIVAIAVAIGVAITLVALTFMSFLQSGAYTTVKNIKTNSQFSNSELSDYDTTSPVKSVDIEEVLKSIEADINSLDNQTNYSPDQLSDKSLGL